MHGCVHVCVKMYVRDIIYKYVTVAMLTRNVLY